MFARFKKSLHLFPIFLGAYKEMRGGSRFLHSTVCIKYYKFPMTCILLKKAKISVLLHRIELYRSHLKAPVRTTVQWLKVKEITL